MAHYAKINSKGIVENVIVADDDFIASGKIEGNWVKTSYNTMGGVHYTQNEDGTFGDPSDDQTKALRKNYAGIGDTFDVVRDAFIPKKPFNSWTLNETTCRWECPTGRPEDGATDYVWNEETQTWDANATE